MELAQRISFLLEYSGQNISEFSRYVGFKTPQAVRELIKGNTKTLSESAQSKILAAYPELNPSWLLTGEGDMLRDVDTVQSDEKLSERIRAIVNHTGLSIPKYAQAIGVQTPQAIRDLISGKTRSLSESVQSKILSYSPEINPSWLFTGEGEMLKQPYKVDEIEIPINEELDLIETEIKAGRVTFVPLIPTAALANSLAEYIGPGVKHGDCQMIVSPVPGADFAIQISGDSMEPKFQDGYFVFIKKIDDEAFIPWGNTMVLDTVNGTYIKNVFPIKDEPDSIEARSINPLYPPFVIPKSSIFGIYRVLGSAKFFTTM